jgi:soluble epoxide hydrolase / lipid-phosphate phosphatase
MSLLCACRYGWRYQIGPWVRAGYRVVVPDMLGYGGTDKPLGAEEYSTKKLCADLAALLNVIRVPKAVSVCPLEMRSHALC